MTVPKKIQAVYEKATRIFNKDQIETALNHMAEKIHGALADQNPILMCVMKGGIVLMGNLLPRLDFPLEIDYVHVTRYQGKTTGGDIVWLAKPTCNLKDRIVLLIDDILDAGVTLKTVADHCLSQGAQKIYTAVLINKVRPRTHDSITEADFVALSVEDRFVFGYGLDYDEYLRNVPGIYEVAAEHQ